MPDSEMIQNLLKRLDWSGCSSENDNPAGCRREHAHSVWIWSRACRANTAATDTKLCFCAKAFNQQWELCEDCVSHPPTAWAPATWCEVNGPEEANGKPFDAHTSACISWFQIISIIYSVWHKIQARCSCQTWGTTLYKTIRETKAQAASKCQRFRMTG